MAQNNFGQQMAVPGLPMEAGMPVEQEVESPENMEAHPNEVQFYKDVSQKFMELAEIVKAHGEWHASLAEK